jgi:peptidoglycan/LPS O-acetylase OafA/YrhL
LWSLSVEEMFYLFFPLVCSALGRSWALIGVLGVFVVLGPFARTVLSQGNEVWREYSYLGGMDAIALGCLTALLLSAKSFSTRTLVGLGVGGTAILIFMLCFSLRAMNMTVLALSSCMVMVAASETQWQSPSFLTPLLKLGQGSYEVYLTHMFVVFALFGFFLDFGKPLWGVPVLFVTVIVAAGLLGDIVARFYSEPMNRFLRGLA